MYERYFSSLKGYAKVNVEFAQFSTKIEDFDDYDSICERYTIDPRSWWATHGTYTPMLQKIDFKVLGQPSPSSCCERNWSTYYFINSIKRNKMTPQRVEDLVSIYSNLHLLFRKTLEYLKGETMSWDIVRDAFNSLEDVDMLEVANLSLDDRELEAEIIKEDGAHKDEDVIEI